MTMKIKNEMVKMVEKKMDFPRVIYKTSPNLKSNADIVKEQLDKMYDHLIGSEMKELTLAELEYTLTYISDYVTLIATGIYTETNIYRDTKQYLVYLYNHDAAKYYKYQVALQNAHGNIEIMMNYEEKTQELLSECIQKGNEFYQIP